MSVKNKRKTRGALKALLWLPPGTFAGLPFNPPVAPRIRYQTKMEQMIAHMSAETIRELKALYRRNDAPGIAMDSAFSYWAKVVTSRLRKRFDKIFGSDALGISKTFTESIDKQASQTIDGSLRGIIAEGLTLPQTPKQTAAMSNVLKATVEANVSLIKSIPSKYYDDVEGFVMRSIQAGKGLADLVPQLEYSFGVSRRRARIIARDQTNKANTAIARQRMLDAGVSKFRWLHSGGDKEPRSLHLNELNGNVYEFDNPPVIDKKTGERGLPGQLINCTCRMVPIFSFIAQEVQ